MAENKIINSLETLEELTGTESFVVGNEYETKKLGIDYLKNYLIAPIIIDEISFYELLKYSEDKDNYAYTEVTTELINSIFNKTKEALTKHKSLLISYAPQNMEFENNKYFELDKIILDNEASLGAIINNFVYSIYINVENNTLIVKTLNNTSINLKELNEKIDNKVDSEEGKGLSTNDFTNEDKEALGNKVDKVEGKQLSTEDFTTALKQKLDGLTNYDDSNLANLYLAKAGGTMNSTNKVNNLNADLLDGKEADEFVEKTGSVMTGPLSFTTGINEAYKKNGLIFIKDNATEQARVGTDDSGIFGMYNVGDYIALRPGFDFVEPNTNVGLEIYQNKMVIGGVTLPTFVKLTEAEYDAIEVKDPNTIYFMTE